MTAADWPGFRDGGLIVPLPATWFAPPAPTIEVDATCFQVKPEFHVTVFNRETGRRVQDALPLARIRQLFEAEDWTPARTGDGVMLRARKRRDGRDVERMSLIELVELPGLHRFRGAIAEASGIALPEVPPHVTLFTAGDPSGIGLASMQALRDSAQFRFRLPAIAPRTPPMPDAALLDAYRDAAYAIDGLAATARIGERCPAVERECERIGATRASIVTAFNPYSEQSDSDGNRLRQRWLAAELRASGLTVIAAEGRDPAGHWPPEESLLVPGSTPELDDCLMRAYEQHAVVVVEAGRPAQLLLHPDSRA